MPDHRGPDLRVLRAEERAVTRSGGVTTWHCFSYGDHYDPDNVSFGPLRAVNEELLAPAAGYDEHRHADVEIVTWVLDGVLEHRDSAGHHTLLRPGTVLHVNAGSGIDHVERNASPAPLRFVQMMLAPGEDQLAAPPAPPTHRWVEVEGARGRLLPALTVRPGVGLFVALLDAGDVVDLPAGSALHLHVTRGHVAVRSDAASLSLGAGDTARAPRTGAMTATAEVASEIVVWQLPPIPADGGTPCTCWS